MANGWALAGTCALAFFLAAGMGARAVLVAHAPTSSAQTWNCAWVSLHNDGPGEAVASGAAEFGVLPVSEILPVKGAEVLGTFPAAVQSYIVMVGGVSAHAAHGAAAREFIAFLMAPAALPTIKGKGMERQTPTPPAAQAPAPDPSDVAEGMRLYQQKANCQACHGWAADGRKTDNQMPTGANLRETRLGRPVLVMTIKCGRLNSSMPAYDKFAYSDGRCYGKTQADLKAYATRMPDPPATLQPREIELIADFLIAKAVGKGPMDHAKCVDFWGADVEACGDLPK